MKKANVSPEFEKNVREEIRKEYPDWSDADLDMVFMLPDEYFDKDGKQIFPCYMSIGCL